MTNKIITKFARKGINLSPDAYYMIKNSKRPIDLASNIIIKLKSGKYSDDDLISVSESIVKEIMKDLGHGKEKDIKSSKSMQSESRLKTAPKDKKIEAEKPAMEAKPSEAKPKTQDASNVKPEAEKPTIESKPAEAKPKASR